MLKAQPFTIGDQMLLIQRQYIFLYLRRNEKHSPQVLQGCVLIHVMNCLYFTPQVWRC